MPKIAALMLTVTLAVPATVLGEHQGTDVPRSPFDPEAAARTIAPLLDDQPMIIIRVDATRIDVDATAKWGLEFMKKIVAKFDKKEPLNPSERAILEGDEQRTGMAQLKAMAKVLLGGFKMAGGKEIYVIYSLGDYFDGPVVFVPLGPAVKPDVILGLLSTTLAETGMTFEQFGNGIVAGSKPVWERLRKFRPTPRPEVAKAFAAAGDTTAQILLLASPDARRVIEETLPSLPKEVGGGPSTTLTRGVMWAAVGIEGPPKPSVQLTVQSENDTAAKALHEWLLSTYRRLGRQKETRNYVADFDQVAALLTPRLKGDQLTLTLDDDNEGISKLATAFVPAFQGARQQANKIMNQNNLTQLGVVMHMYHSNYGSLPATANRDEQGRPLLSWRVHVLPYLEQEELYRQFHLDEPWDSEHNKKLILRMPKFYLSPDHAGINEHPGKTTYVVPVGEPLTFTGGAKGVRFSEITDGTSHTIMLIDVDADRAVIWTKPDDLKVDPNNPKAGLTGISRWNDVTGFAALFADGSVRTVPADIEPKTLWALFTRNGGEMVTPP